MLCGLSELTLHRYGLSHKGSVTKNANCTRELAVFLRTSIVSETYCVYEHISFSYIHHFVHRFLPFGYRIEAVAFIIGK